MPLVFFLSLCGIHLEPLGEKSEDVPLDFSIHLLLIPNNLSLMFAACIMLQ